MKNFYDVDFKVGKYGFKRKRYRSYDEDLDIGDTVSFIIIGFSIALVAIMLLVKA